MGHAESPRARRLTRLADLLNLVSDPAVRRDEQGCLWRRGCLTLGGPRSVLVGVEDLARDG